MSENAGQAIIEAESLTKRVPSPEGELVILDAVSLADFYFAINDVQSSLIRVEADEATYNLHILIRFELEQSLLSGDLAVAGGGQRISEVLTGA